MAKQYYLCAKFGQVYFFCYLRPENGFKAQGYAMQTHLFSPLRLLV